MAEQQSQQQPGTVTFNYSLDKARVVYGLVEKPADMSDQEWAIVSDEGFRRYLATQLGIQYFSRQDMMNRGR
jgi:hypothetical protein